MGIILRMASMAFAMPAIWISNRMGHLFIFIAIEWGTYSYSYFAIDPGKLWI